MRTTLNTIYSNIQTNLAKITTDMSRINGRISSGQQMSKISDDPVNLVSALRFRSTVVELDQYSENITAGDNIITASEAALTQIKDLAIRAKTLAIQATDPGLTSDNLKSIAEEIKNLFEQSVQLGNTQINGKFIFGGFRTSGYTDLEPAPFITDKGDGHWINGTAMTPLDTSLTSSVIATAATATDLVAGDLLINGVDVGAVDLTTAADVSGVNMTGADNLKTAINAKSTVYANNAATADTTGSAFTFDLNTIPISVSIAAGSNATTVANTTITAINTKTAATGVTAVLGDGTNGGPVDSVVFKNAQTGDNATITVSNFTTVTNGGATTGFGNFSKKIVTAALTTQTAGAVIGAGAVGGEVMDFSINGTRIAYTLTAGNASQTAQQTVDAINQASQLTGITAQLGNGNNGGPAPSVVLTNTLSGDESDIVLADITPGVGNEGDLSGLTTGTYSVGAANNNGQLSFSSAASIAITTSGATPATPNDTILNLIGLGGGSKGNYDEAGDGKLVYGYPLNAGELEINSISVPATSEDSDSTVYADASATAKAAAINSITDKTGVSATIDPAQVKASGAVNAGTEPIRPTGKVSNTVIRAGELAVNGTIISAQIDNGASSTYGLSMTKANNAKTAINAEFPTTGVQTLLTTLSANSTPAIKGSTLPVDFTVNGINVSLTVGGISANNTASSVASAINAVTTQTGVQAVVGDGTNGGIKDSIVLFNSIKGNESAIAISGLSAPPPPAAGGSESELIGLFNSNQIADASNNTGEISFDSESTITLSTTSIAPGADIIINELGFSSNNTTTLGVGNALTGTVDGTSINAGLYVNGNLVGPITGGAPTNLINMDMAASAKTQIETAAPNVSVKLTTLTNGVATSDASADSNVSFKLNGALITVSYASTATAAAIASATVTAINQVTADTGVQALVGTGIPDGTPAGNAPLSAIVFKNNSGDDTAISITEMAVNSGNNNLGFSNFSQAADATHNTGEITISSTEPFDLSTPATLNDTILNHLGLGIGASAGYSEKADGLVYGSDGTGEGIATFGASPEFMSSGDLTINGQDIFVTDTAVVKNDQTNVLVGAINAQTGTTGVTATRGADGVLRLTATDGRNIHIQTSSNGEDITHLTDGNRDLASFGTLQLNSDRKFTLETIKPTTNSKEPGLAAIGMAGGSGVTGEPNDTAGDGKINVFSIHDQIGTVRYTGDRVNDLEVKIGKTSTMVVGENGKTGLVDTSVFTTLKSMEDYLRGQNFSTVTGFQTATDTSQTLNSKKTGLEPEDQLPDENLFTDGSFTVSVTDNDYYPTRTYSLALQIDTATDTLDSVTQRLDGIPNLSAVWTSDGHLKIETSDPDRYTLALTNDSSNFLQATGVSFEFMQNNAISQSMDNLDTLMSNLTEQISDFGARSNRIQIQSQIYSEMTISTRENLSEVQDTDMIKAAMDLKAKEVAYQAALSAAAKTMQLSLVDFL